MARTKASVGAKVSAGKSNKARCSVAPPGHSGGSSGGGGRGGGGGGGGAGGGNSVCPRETPRWQRPITSFFSQPHSALERALPDELPATSSAARHKHKRNAIESDDEDEEPDPPKNTELDESIHLEPLTGEHSHKLEEYYPKNGEKGKGVGKKTKGKENLNVTEKNNKREREESLEESVSKKVKI